MKEVVLGFFIYYGQTKFGNDERGDSALRCIPAKNIESGIGFKCPVGKPGLNRRMVCDERPTFYSRCSVHR